MKLSCPACAATFDLDAAVNDADARRFGDLIAGIPPAVAKPLVQYLALFRPKRTGLRWSRMLTLTQELAPMITNARIERNGIAYAVPAEVWTWALLYMIEPPEGLSLPLKSHGYLLEVIANQMRRIAAKQEHAREQSRKQRTPGAGRAEVDKMRHAIAGHATRHDYQDDSGGTDN